MSSSALVITITALVGQSLAGDARLATVPVALQFATVALVTLPASLLMQRFGRRAGFSLGALSSMLAGLLGMYAITEGSFTLYCAASMLFGVGAAFAFHYRFAAADTAADPLKSRAISLVMAGGVVAAFAGPELSKWTADLFAPVTFAGAFLAMAGLQVIALTILQFLTIPPPPRTQRVAGGRPLTEIARSPVFLVAVLCGMVAYGAMNLLMTSTPLAMIGCNHSFGAAAFVIQWHIVGMYAPSFVTGHLIHRFGIHRILATGAILMLACVAVNLTGVEVAQFWASLVLLGVGWNFLYIGGSSLLTQAYDQKERAKVQGVNDLCVFATVTLTALSSGAAYAEFGWVALNLAIVGPVLLVVLGVLWLARRTPKTAL